MTPEQNAAVSFVDNVLVGYQGTLRNQSESEVIYVLKDIIKDPKIDMLIDEVSLQDVMAIVLNKMIPRYRVVSARSKGRNLVTYYKLQEVAKPSGRIKQAIKNHLLAAIQVVKSKPHNK